MVVIQYYQTGHFNRAKTGGKCQKKKSMQFLEIFIGIWEFFESFSNIMFPLLEGKPCRMTLIGSKIESLKIAIEQCYQTGHFNRRKIDGEFQLSTQNTDYRWR